LNKAVPINDHALMSSEEILQSDQIDKEFAYFVAEIFELSQNQKTLDEVFSE